MQPLFTNDAVVLGLLMAALAFVFKTHSSENPAWKKFYTYVPALLLCYFIPALLHWPLGLIASEWVDVQGLTDFAAKAKVALPDKLGYESVSSWIKENKLNDAKSFLHKSQLYFVASRYLLPASLLLLCLSIDLKSIFRLGYKALIMFFTATMGIVLGGPIAVLLVRFVAPDLIPVAPEELWRGLSTVAGSWIGGGANQTAMKEIYEVSDNLFATMIIVDVLVANIWMGFLLYGANLGNKLDKKLKADTSAIEDLKQKMEEYQSTVKKIPSTTDSFLLMAVAFGGVAIAHLVADFVSNDFMTPERVAALENANLHALTGHFFWLIVIVTTLGVLVSFTPLRRLEGVGASRWGSVFIYVLVATIGMKMNLSEVAENLGLFAIGITWMIVHVSLLLLVGWLIRAPFFYIAVGSQANVGGAASAPIVASAFHPSLAPVGALLAVLGYAMGTYFAIICAYLMQMAAS